MAKRQPLGKTASSKRGSQKPPSPSEVDEILSQVNKDSDSPVSKVKRAKAPPKDEKYKLTGFISKDLFRRMKMHCVSNDGHHKGAAPSLDYWWWSL